MTWRLVGLSTLLFSLPLIGLAADSGSTVRTVDLTGHEERSFIPFPGFSGGLSVTAADLGSDGVEEIIVASGAGMKPTVGVFRQDGSKINEFLAYGESFTRGVNVAVCDVNGDDRNEIITGAAYGGGPHVRIFSSTGVALYPGFFAYEQSFRGGVNVACGDIDGNGTDDIMTGAGITGGPHIKVFSPTGVLLTETFTGSVTENTGATIAAGDVDGDGNAEILVARAGRGDNAVSVLDARNGKLSLHTFLPATATANGTPLFTVDANRDARDDIGYGSDTTLLRTKSIFGTDVANISFATSTPGRIMNAAALESADTQKLLIFQANSAVSSNTDAQYIRVDLSEQKLTAYEYGMPVKEFLVSTGTKYYPSPKGVTTVTDKLLWHDYGGPGYWLPDVQYNLRFRKGYYIHSAYWHNNFGTPMSHGCINTSLTDAEWIYTWANVGATVEIAE